MMDTLRQIQLLRTEINQHNISYYVYDDPVISDAEYDRRFRRLLEIEKAHPELKTDDSPTHRVGAPPQSDLAQVPHRFPMLSLDNVFNDEELVEFDLRIKRHLGMDAEAVVHYAVEPKIDGLGIELVYEDSVLAVASTRGDGRVAGEQQASLQERSNEHQRGDELARVHSAKFHLAAMGGEARPVLDPASMTAIARNSGVGASAMPAIPSAATRAAPTATARAPIRSVSIAEAMMAMQEMEMITGMPAGFLNLSVTNGTASWRSRTPGSSSP